MLFYLQAKYIAFYAAVLVPSLIIQYFNTASFAQKAKESLILLSSLFFLHFFLAVSFAHLSILMGLAISLFFTSKKGRSKIYLILSLVVLVLIFLFSKTIKTSSLQGHHHFFNVLGISYIILKFVHYLIDSKAGVIKEKSFLIFINFIFFFPTFIAGPIFRYQDFYEELSTTKKKDEIFSLIISGVKRIIIGMFKLIVVSKFTAPFAFFNLGPAFLLHSSFWGQVLYANIGMLNLYFNFAGYSDLAIGIGAILGIKVPENFNYPLLVRNLQDFWKHWHITLSNWMKNYIFFPFYKWLLEINNQKLSLNFISSLSLFLTFFLMGIFNGIGINYFLHGLSLASGVVVVFLWGNFLKKRNILKKYLAIKPIKLIATIMTINYFSFCVLFFDANTPEKLQLLFKIFKSYAE